MTTVKKQIHVGCSAFYNRHWKGIFYPDKLPQTKWFDFYCEQFKTLELNSTFYRFPTEKTFDTWYKKSGSDFQFSVKAPRVITHLKKFNECSDLIKDLYAVCQEGLGEKLANILFQLPPSIHYSEEKLNQVIDSLNPDFSNVVEFRHESWWQQSVYDRLAEHDIVFCSVSHPTMPESIVVNSQTAYIRLHGSPKLFYSNYTDGYLEELCQSIMHNSKIKEAFVYFNNTASTAGVSNAMEMQKLASKA